MRCYRPLKTIVLQRTGFFIYNTYSTICQTKRSTRNLTGVEDIVLCLGLNDNCTIFFVGFKENSGFSNSRANIQPPNQICRSLPTKNRIFLSRPNQRIILWRYFFDNRKHNVCFSFSLFWSHNLLSQAGECVHYNWKRPQISFQNKNQFKFK